MGFTLMVRSQGQNTHFKIYVRHHGGLGDEFPTYENIVEIPAGGEVHPVFFSQVQAQHVSPVLPSVRQRHWFQENGLSDTFVMETALALLVVDLTPLVVDLTLLLADLNLVGTGGQHRFHLIKILNISPGLRTLINNTICLSYGLQN